MKIRRASDVEKLLVWIVPGATDSGHVLQIVVDILGSLGSVLGIYRDL